MIAGCSRCFTDKIRMHNPNKKAAQKILVSLLIRTCGRRQKEELKIGNAMNDPSHPTIPRDVQCDIMKSWAGSTDWELAEARGYTRSGDGRTSCGHHSWTAS